MTFLTVQFGELFRWEGLGLDILGAGLRCMRRALPEFLAHPKNKMSSCATSYSADEERPPPPPPGRAGGGGDAATAKEEYDFIEQPSQEYFCPVTFELLVYPDQTTCCGHHISREAVERIQKDKKPCPMCKEANLTIVPDKFFRRKVHELKVQCYHKKGGCEWVGDLGSYDNHVKKCPKRPWTCEFCDFKSTYDIGNDDHLPNCEKRPVPCPNACEINTISLSDVESHLLECPLQLVACELAHTGCSALVARRDLPLHMKESVQQHLLSASLLNLQLTRDKIEQQEVELKEKDKRRERDLKESDLKYAELVKEKEQQLARKEKEHTDILKERMAEKDRQIAELQKTIGDGIVSLQQKFEKHTHATETNFVKQSDIVKDVQLALGFVKHEFILTDFNKRIEGHKDIEWFGESLYSHSGGYCLQPNVDIDSSGNTAAYIYLRKGDYDDRLSWPVEVEVRLKVLNQRGDHTHHIATANCKFSLIKSLYDDTYKAISTPLLLFSELQYDAAKDCEYLKNDCLKFELYVKAAPVRK